MKTNHLSLALACHWHWQFCHPSVGLEQPAEPTQTAAPSRLQLQPELGLGCTRLLRSLPASMPPPAKPSVQLLPCTSTAGSSSTNARVQIRALVPAAPLIAAGRMLALPLPLLRQWVGSLSTCWAARPRSAPTRRRPMSRTIASTIQWTDTWTTRVMNTKETIKFSGRH